MLAERVGKWPVALSYLLLILLAQDNGGGCPVALQCSLQRVWEGCRENCFDGVGPEVPEALRRCWEWPCRTPGSMEVDA